MRSSLGIAMLVAGAWACSARVTAVAGDCPAPTYLSCELLLAPAKTVIYDPLPEFSWQCGSGDSAFNQSAYEIEVWDSATQSPDRQLMWSSGRVDGDHSLNVEYAGNPLRAGQQYFWRVRAWNDYGQQSPWSELQVFRMAHELSERKTSRYPVAKVVQHAVVINQLGERNLLADFGTAAFGYLVLHLPPTDQARDIEVTFGEKLAGQRIDRNPGGTIRTYQVAASIPQGATTTEIRPPKDTRNTTGDAVAIPHGMGVVAPFRYVEISGLAEAPVRECIAQVRIEYPFDEQAAAFECSDDTLNAIWELCKYTIRATTFCGVYVDGDRERIPYEADAYINQLAHYGVDREYALARHSHEYLLANPTWPTEWKQHSVLMAFADYWYTGDIESVERSYDVLKQEKLLTVAERDDGLLDTSDGYRDIVDWPESERDGYEMLPVNTVVNAFHYATLRRMSTLAAALVRTEDQKQFADKADAFKRVFNRVFWDEGACRYVDGENSQHSSLHANLFPLAFGLAPPERRQAVVDFVRSRRMRCSVYAAQYLLEGLYRAGEDQYALELLTSRSKRSWYNMIRSGSTVTLEAWDQAYKPNLDWNHAWGAAPANLIPRYLAGVRPAQAGFRRIVVQPRPGNLDSFTAKVPSPRGPIYVSYVRSENGVKLDVVVPGNSVAKVGIPLEPMMHSVKILANSKAVEARVVDAHAWLDDIAPGKHSFQVIGLSTVTQVSDAASVQP